MYLQSFKIFWIVAVSTYPLPGAQPNFLTTGCLRQSVYLVRSGKLFLTREATDLDMLPWIYICSFIQRFWRCHMLRSIICTYQACSIVLKKVSWLSDALMIASTGQSWLTPSYESILLSSAGEPFLAHNWNSVPIAKSLYGPNAPTTSAIKSS